jgi:hypothetical protein
MITTTHARPQLQPFYRTHSSVRVVLCPRCSLPMGSANGPRQLHQLLSLHRCGAAEREKLQPSAPVPFS